MGDFIRKFFNPYEPKEIKRRKLRGIGLTFFVCGLLMTLYGLLGILGFSEIHDNSIAHWLAITNWTILVIIYIPAGYYAFAIFPYKGG